MGISGRRAWGILANLVFWPALFVFGALRPDYDQLTKAISELGALGAPNMLAWNLFGFVLPGILLALAGDEIGRASGRPIARLLLVLSGLAFAATAIPADMSSYEAPTTIAHLSASLASLATWLAALLWLTARGTADWRTLRALAAAGFVVFALAFSLHFVPDATGGLAQRAAFAAYLGWYIVVSLAPWPKRA
jgi:hypothetical membrane protein